MKKIFQLLICLLNCLIVFSLFFQKNQLEKKLTKYENCLIIPLKYRNTYLDTIFSIASYFSQLDVEVFYAVAKVESNFNPLAIGDKGKSIGLFQIQEHEWRECLKNPLINAIIFGKILKNLETRYGNIIFALAVYNGGTKGNFAYAQKVWKELKKEGK